MKKVLIISPHFPPINAADIHRVRHSLPYFEKYGFQPTILTVLPEHVEMSQDKLLEMTIPNDIPVHKVTAYSIKYTRKFSLGNLGIRSFYQLYKKGNELLKSGDFDLVYFSTTVFACIPLGRLWKKKYKVPFIIDMQDPWRNDYYLSVPKDQRPPKFWFAHQLNSYLERFSIPKVDGIISVSKGYIDTLRERYPTFNPIPYKVLTFGTSVKDFDLLMNQPVVPSITYNQNNINIVYLGRGGQDIRASVTLVLQAFKMGLENNIDFKKCHFWFIGTSYAPDGLGKKTISIIAENLGISSYVTEITDRQPYFEVLSLLGKSDINFIPGSTDTSYTPSKLYPYILAKKPLLCVFHSKSSVLEIMENLNVGKVVHFDKDNALEQCYDSLSTLLATIPFVPNTNWDNFQRYTAEEMTKSQCEFFEQVILKSK